MRRFKLQGLIDFGVMKRRSRAATFCRMPLALIVAASRHRLPIEISLYDVT
jgi:hypothetical protein